MTSNRFESGYYPPGAENDPRAPWNQVDIRDTPRGDEMADKLFRVRLNDTEGYFVESLSEASTERLKALSEAYLKWMDEPMSKETDNLITIARIVCAMIAKGCEPSDEDIEEALTLDERY